MPAVERTEFPIPTLCLSQTQSECVVSASCTDVWLHSAPAAAGSTTSPICLDLNSGQDSYNCVLTSSTWITIAPRAQANFAFTASTMSPELRISAVPMIRHP